MERKPNPPAPTAGMPDRTQRLVPDPPPDEALLDLAAGHSVEEVARLRGLSLPAARALHSMVRQAEQPLRVCEGTACRFGGSGILRERLIEQGGDVHAVRCLGHCHAAPAFRQGSTVFACPAGVTPEAWLDLWGEGPHPAADLVPPRRSCLASEPVVLRHLLTPERSAPPFEDYELPGAERILDSLAEARLRGRGGAAMLTHEKWRLARATPADERFVVANAGEGDPGSFVARVLLEEDPHAVLAGMLACARVIGARRGFAYVRAEYPLAQRSLRRAIAEARREGRLGEAFDVEVVAGAGQYVCGEETALLSSLEGGRGEPRSRPPEPMVSGLWGRPTVVQNVETFAVVPWVARHARPHATKVVSLSGAVQRTGVVEVPVGTPLVRVLEEAGGGAPAGTAWKLALIGGPLGCVLPASEFHTPLSWDALPGLGHAGVVVLDESVRIRDLAEHLFAFAVAESCGACEPCRDGVPRLAPARDRASLERVLAGMETGGLCGFSAGVARPVRDLLRHFGDEVFA
jgi:NADH:ubiquinone oxidoreductase subunit F (NADH-binding)